MKKKLNKSKKTFIALGALLSMIARGQDVAPASHNSPQEKKPALTFDGAPRTPQQKSQYDALIEKLDAWIKSSAEGSHSVSVSGDELTVHLSSFEVESTIESVKQVKRYRDAVEKQCKGIDESAILLLNTIDYCLVNNVILPAVNKSKIELNRFETKLSSKAVNTCHDELKAFFAEKEKRTDLTEKDLFKADQDAAKSLSYIFESFGAKKDNNISAIADNSELVKSVKKVNASNLCQVKLDKSAPVTKDETKEDKKSAGKPKADVSKSSPHKSEYEESVEETFEEEEIYQPLAPKKIIEEAKPATQPLPQPAPTYQPAKPTYQPVPYQQTPAYQPAPYKPKSYEPAPAPRAKSNPPPFIPAPAPRRGALVNGPGPVPFAGVPIARSFGLSLGFGSYNSTVQAVPPPMPYYPPVMGTTAAMPMGGMMGPSLTGVSTATPRACLVCSSTPTVMPTLGLANLMARPCPVTTMGMAPVGACLPNMNQPVMGYTGINPYFNQIPRYPGAPVVPGTGNQPTLGVGGGTVTPSRTTIPRTTPTLLMRSQRRLRR